jgi:hypothetical protein
MARLPAHSAASRKPSAGGSAGASRVFKTDVIALIGIGSAGHSPPQPVTQPPDIHRDSERVWCRSRLLLNTSPLLRRSSFLPSALNSRFFLIPTSFPHHGSQRRPRRTQKCPVPRFVLGKYHSLSQDGEGNGFGRC